MNDFYCKFKMWLLLRPPPLKFKKKGETHNLVCLPQYKYRESKHCHDYCQDNQFLNEKLAFCHVLLLAVPHQFFLGFPLFCQI